MSAVEELDQWLAGVVVRVNEALDGLAVAREDWQEHWQLLSTVLGDTNDSDMQHVLGTHGDTDEAIHTAAQKLRQVREHIENYRATTLRVSATGTGVGTTASDRGRKSTLRQTRTVKGVDGSGYSEDAAWAVDLLPRRVQQSFPGERTVGYVDDSLADRFISGSDGAWTPYIQERASRVGIPPRIAAMLSTHVELKVAAMLIQRGQQRGQLVINHVPCGSQPNQRTGCHQVIERFLPYGYSLTVHGTTQAGEPFSYTYKGQA